MNPSSPAASITADQLRAACGEWATGVAVVTGTGQNGSALGMAVNSFSSLSLDPPLVLFCPAATSSTWPLIEVSGRFAVNILTEEQHELARVFAASGGDKFAAVETRDTADGLPAIAEAGTRLVCSVRDTFPGGDHTIVVANVEAVEHISERPLVFHRGRTVRLHADS